MLPIVVIDGTPQNESLDIIALVDHSDKLQTSSLINSSTFHELNKLLDKLGQNIHNLAMPYWVWTPEFTPASRQYFQVKKEIKRGPFKDLVKNRPLFEEKLKTDLETFLKDLHPFYQSDKFTIYDILIASHLWGLYIVPEFQFPEKINRYLNEIKSLCHFDYHKDFWC